MVGLELIPPALFRLQIFPAFDDDRIGQIPFECRAIQLVFVGDEVLAQNLGLKFRQESDHAQSKSFIDDYGGELQFK
jgi:hypothetical protein